MKNLSILLLSLIFMFLLSLRSEIAAKDNINNSSWEWNTFMGSSSDDRGYDIAVDVSGNVYVTGRSGATWGSPINAHAGWVDAFVAKLNSSGVLQWNTFMGSAVYDDFGLSIAVDGSGNVYVAGYSDATWGTPVNDYAGGNYDAFVAKLNSSGVLQWNTFMGGSDSDYGNGIAVDGNGNVYVTGDSRANWGTPKNAYAGGNYDAFAAKLNSSGELQWNTFMGSNGTDYGKSIAVDGSGNVYVTGLARYTWGSPVNAHAGGSDAFAEKLNSDGVRQWNTFMGSSSAISDAGNGITVDGSGNVYITGQSYDTWGNPINAHRRWEDAFAAKLNSSGVLQWNTFMGSPKKDYGHSIAVDGNGNVYITGESDTTWGVPANAFTGDAYKDVFAAILNNSGVLLWNTFMGGSDNDYGNGIVVDGSGNVYVAGITYLYEWGTPVNAHAGWGNDAFAVKFEYTTAVEDEIDLNCPTEFNLSQNYPNPFNAITSIKYALPNADHVALKVYNTLGKEIKTLVNQFQTQGNYVIAFDATQLSSGIYLYELNAGNSHVQIKKMILIK